MSKRTKLKVAALIDLMRTPESGGHVKCWERLAHAAAKTDLPLDLTLFFSGRPVTEILAPHVRLYQLPQLLSTSHLKIIPQPYRQPTLEF